MVLMAVTMPLMKAWYNVYNKKWSGEYVKEMDVVDLEIAINSHDIDLYEYNKVTVERLADGKLIITCFSKWFFQKLNY